MSHSRRWGKASITSGILDETFLFGEPKRHGEGSVVVLFALGLGEPDGDGSVVDAPGFFGFALQGGGDVVEGIGVGGAHGGVPKEKGASEQFIEDSIMMLYQAEGVV